MLNIIRNFIIIISIALLPIEVPAQQVSPHEPYKLINKILNDLKDIRKQRNVNTIIKSISHDDQKTPTDVYLESYALLEKLQLLAKKEGFKLDQEIILPEKIKQRAIPLDVLALLEQVKEITEQICIKLEIDAEEVVLISDLAITPPDVYQKVQKANKLVDTLL